LPSIEELMEEKEEFIFSKILRVGDHIGRLLDEQPKEKENRDTNN